MAGLGLLMSWPGVPMVFAGDEVGVEGFDQDVARQPMPWDEDRWDRELFDGLPRPHRGAAGQPRPAPRRPALGARR